MDKMQKIEENKTPMQSAMEKIRTAWIAAFISAAITLIFIVISLGGNTLLIGIDAYAIIDFVLVVGLAVLLLTIKSRIAAVILLVHYLASQLILRIENPGVGGIGSIFMVVAFIAAYSSGILGTFSYHKLKKQERMENM